ncbi:MAG: alcohol dehydrogenase catalytic domain-containing protein [Deltaproteobacteria bacterium]|nr:alcohol dehydrogenase catalytic domain-containing protein [Deltaproteobacteria bacterium]
MKAAILLDQGRLEVRDVPTPVCLEGGVLVKVKACGICTADLKIVSKGHRALVYPRILGHEIAGIVSESRTNIFKTGDRVQVAPGLKCGKCSHCLSGADNQCKDRGIFGFTRDGGFADYVAVPVEGSVTGTLNLLPEDLSDGVATLAEPLACCINAQEKVDIKKTDTVLIIGGGTLGLLHCFLALEKGIENIFIAETRPHRRKTALEFGAEKVFDPADDRFFDLVMDAADPKGVDVIIFACGQAGLNEKFMNLLARGGRVSVFSGVSPDLSLMQLDLNLVHYNEIIITGAYGCTAHQNSEAVKILASGKLPVGKLITSRVSLEAIKQGLDHTDSRQGFKSIVEV